MRWSRQGIGMLVLAIISALAHSIWGMDQGSPQTRPATSMPATAPFANPLSPLSADPFFQFYAVNLRGSLFSGCLTLGSFLLAVNTFIVVNLKKEVYEHKKYRQRVRQHRKGNSKSTYYGPLKRLSGFLLWTISFAFVAAVAQLTLGVLFHHWLSAVVCLGLAGAMIVLLFVTLVLIKQNQP